MKCPRCGTNGTLVIDSRGSGEMRRRRRVCRKCDHKFTTTEAVGLIKKECLPLLLELRLCKRGGGVQDFDPAKLRRSILLACKKGDVETELVDGVVGRVRELVRSSCHDPVPVQKLVMWVTEKLLEIDKISGMRYAAMTVDEKDARKFKAALVRAVK